MSEFGLPKHSENEAENVENMEYSNFYGKRVKKTKTVTLAFGPKMNSYVALKLEDVSYISALAPKV